MENVNARKLLPLLLLPFSLFHFPFAVSAFAADTIHLRAFGVPSEFKITPQYEADRLVLDAFRKKYPWIDPVSTEGLKLGTSDRAYMMEPFLQIAGDIAPDVLYVTFKRKDWL